MATLQVRSVEDQLYEALGKRAVQDNRSISQEVVAILKEYFSRPSPPGKANDKFLELCGTWQDDRTPVELTEVIRKSRKSTRRFKEIF